MSCLFINSSIRISNDPPNTNTVCDAAAAAVAADDAAMCEAIKAVPDSIFEYWKIEHYLPMTSLVYC